MDTIDEVDGRRHRRKHSDEFKAKVIAAFRRPGISIASVALANKLNANLLRTWVAITERAEPRKSAGGATDVATLAPPAEVQTAAAFIPLHVQTTPVPPPPTDRPITIELVHDGIGIWLCARRLHQGGFVRAAAETAPHMTISDDRHRARRRAA